MDVRGLFLVVGVVGASVVALSSGCTVPDPGEITYSERKSGATGESSSGGSSGSSGTSSGGSSGTSSGSTSSGDGGSSGAGGDPVFGATAFAAGQPGRGAPAKAANAAHNGDASGKDCIPCHNGDWAFAGTLYADAAGGAARVAGAEIRIAGPTGTEIAKAFSDADGNFWIDPTTTIPAGSRVGVRNAAKKMNMAGAVGPNERGCNQGGTCHGGTAGKVYLK